MSEKAASSGHRRRPSQGIFALPDDLSAPPVEFSVGEHTVVVPPPNQAPPRHGGAPPQPPPVKSSEEMSKDGNSKKVRDE
ncbi:hypothetical protein AgCh_013248 [Apium graveolens]